MATMNGVIITATGDLDRCGYCDFENDGSFDSGTETIKTDIPNNLSVKHGATFPFHRWDGSAWVEVTE